MIARMTLKNHPRVKHLRSLWIKQVTWLDDQGVLVLGPRRLRVNYINLIQVSRARSNRISRRARESNPARSPPRQLIVWTVTLVLLAVR